MLTKNIYYNCVRKLYLYYYYSFISSLNIDYNFFPTTKYTSSQIYLNALHFYFAYLFLNEQSVSKFGTYTFPKKLKTFTVLRSPHADKKSREQFHLIEYKYNFSFPIYLCTTNLFYLAIDTNSIGLKINCYNSIFRL